MRFVCFFSHFIFILPLNVFAEDAETLTIENQLIRRILRNDNGIWRTVEFSRADGSDRIAVQSDELAIRLMDGKTVTLEDYQAEGKPEELLRKEAGAGHAEKVYQIRYRHRKELPAAAPTEVVIFYRIGNQPWMWKEALLFMKEGQAIDRLDVERFKSSARGERGGRGRPIFLNRAWFMGLEYPGGHTAHGSPFDALTERIGNFSYVNLGPDEGKKPTGGWVTMWHYPGLVRVRETISGKWVINSKSAVAGVGSKGDSMELAFLDYLETIRVPRRSFLHYNSWYDLRGGGLRIDSLMKTFKGFKENLLDPYKLKMHAFVPDDGWQNRNSISEPNRSLYPDGLSPLARQLESLDSRLGLWWAINGYSSNIGWGVRNGYKQAKTNRHFSRFRPHYCLAEPKYYAEVRKRTEQLIRSGNLSYYKHDFNNMNCLAEGHGHLPTDRHGHEALLDTELDFLDYQRKLQPDIFLNCTNWIWFSPWWLKHAETLWMLAGDHGYSRNWPQLSPREWAMSYRDQHLYRIFSNPQNRPLVSVSDLMTHGIIQGRFQRLGGNQETLREWSDYVMLYYGRGVQLKELYITPDLINKARWDVLGRATRWAVDNSEILANATLIGGDPNQGQILGYVSWLADRCIIVLRNPDIAEQRIRVPFNQTVRYRGERGRRFHGRVIYPYVQELPLEFTSYLPFDLTVPGASVHVYELDAGPPVVKSRPPNSEEWKGITVERSAAGSEKGMKIDIQVPVPDEALARCDLYLIIRGASKTNNPFRFTLNGDSIKPRSASGSGWKLLSFDLTAHRGGSADLSISRTTTDELFRSSGSEQIDCWLIADRPVDVSIPSMDRNMPPMNWHQHRRQTIQVMSSKLAAAAPEPSAVSEQQLKKIKAARIRLMIFGSNSQAQFRDKPVTLNGVPLGKLPSNKGMLDAWQQVFIDLTPEQMNSLRRTNELTIANRTDDMFKMSGACLAVQLEDGTWARTTLDTTVYSSAPSWAHSEGETFKNNRSGKIELKFK